jgi:hypothetical protein
MSKETKIIQLTSCDLDANSDVVLRVKWQIIGNLDRTDETGEPYKVSVKGESALNPPTDTQTFTVYSNLTEAQVIGWISSTQEYLDKDAELERIMALENSPANVIKPLPW